jgi:hypothetical protein
VNSRIPPSAQRAGAHRAPLVLVALASAVAVLGFTVLVNAAASNTPRPIATGSAPATARPRPASPRERAGVGPLPARGDVQVAGRLCHLRDRGQRVSTKQRRLPLRSSGEQR